jgi:protein translocase SEC61 complex gamma subunit
MDDTNKPETTQAEKLKKPGIGSKIMDKIKQYKRVLSVAHKPDREELISSMKITGAGIIFLGSIGFVIFLLYYMIIQAGA